MSGGSSTGWGLGLDLLVADLDGDGVDDLVLPTVGYGDGRVWLVGR